MLIHFLVIISQLVPVTYSYLQICNKNFTDKVCSKESEYIPTISPSPLPTKVEVYIKFDDVIEIDTELYTVTLMITLKLRWIDKRLNVHRSDQYKQRYFDNCSSL